MTTEHPKHTWLITGASSGFGAALAKEVLQSGHHVLATARDVHKARDDHPEIESLGGHWILLDVTSPDTTEVVSRAIKDNDGIDVLVNNAGYGVFGSIEDMNDEEIHQQMNTNFYGPIRVLKAVLPVMRRQGSGTIVNISSVAAIQSRPAAGIYSASKCALEGLSESLEQELRPFNIRVLLVEPGSFRTDFFSKLSTPCSGISQPYRNTTLGQELDSIESADTTTFGNPDDAAERIVDVILNRGLGEGKEQHLRLPLGEDGLTRGRKMIQDRTENYDAMEEPALAV